MPSTGSSSQSRSSNVPTHGGAVPGGRRNHQALSKSKESSSGGVPGLNLSAMAHHHNRNISGTMSCLTFCMPSGRGASSLMRVTWTRILPHDSGVLVTGSGPTYSFR